MRVPFVEKLRLLEFLPDDLRPSDFEEHSNPSCRNQPRKERGLKPLELRRGGNGAIFWTFEQLGALFLYRRHSTALISNRQLMDYLYRRNDEYMRCCRRVERDLLLLGARRNKTIRLLERGRSGVGLALLAAITADHPFTGTAADLLKLLTLGKGEVGEAGTGLHRKCDWTAESIAKWLDRNWKDIEATFDAKREIDRKARTVFSLKLDEMIPFEKLREALSTFPEIALPQFPVLQDALARLFSLAYWGDRVASVAGKKALEDLLPRGNRHPITPHLPEIIEIFGRKRKDINESNARIKKADPRLKEVERVKMLSALYSEDSATILDAIRVQREKAFLVQRISTYLPVSKTQARRAVTAALSRSSK